MTKNSRDGYARNAYYETFAGMQDPRLVAGEDSPIWNNIRPPRPLYPSMLVVDMAGLTQDDLSANSHPQASDVILALKRLGAFED